MDKQDAHQHPRDRQHHRQSRLAPNQHVGNAELACTEVYPSIMKTSPLLLAEAEGTGIFVRNSGATTGATATTAVPEIKAWRSMIMRSLLRVIATAMSESSRCRPSACRHLQATVHALGRYIASHALDCSGTLPSGEEPRIGRHGAPSLGYDRP